LPHERRERENDHSRGKKTGDKLDRCTGHPEHQQRINQIDRDYANVL
jgi:hypothetical protein